MVNPDEERAMLETAKRGAWAALIRRSMLVAWDIPMSPKFNEWFEAGWVAGAGSTQRSPLTDEQIVAVVKAAVAEGRLPWVGFTTDEEGLYTIPVLSESHIKLIRLIEAAHGIPPISAPSSSGPGA